MCAEAGRGIDRSGNRRRDRQSARTGQGKRRRPLSPAGRAARSQPTAGRGDGRARCTNRAVGPRRKGRPQGSALMAKRPPVLAPYHHFTKKQWSALRDGQLMTLTAADIERLRTLSDPISLEEAG